MEPLLGILRPGGGPQLQPSDRRAWRRTPEALTPTHSLAQRPPQPVLGPQIPHYRPGGSSSPAVVTNPIALDLQGPLS
jgi:hypothetical protein